MMAHVEGQSRYQRTLFPEVLDEVVGNADPVRVIDAFVDTLDLADLGFSKVAAEEMGRPPYAPGDLLKLYVYGYLHRVRASRRLEAEAHRNVQVMWLLNRLTPSFKTIADFRKDHAKGIVGVCRAFIRFCREQSLFGAELLAIDGTKIAAVASRKQVMTPKRIEKMNAAIDRKIADYLASMDEADRDEPRAAGAPADVAAAIAALQAQKARLQGHAQELAASGLKQLVVTERDAKLMRTPHGHAVAYRGRLQCADRGRCRAQADRRL
jgi:transposase